MKYGYARVSTGDKDRALQLGSLTSAGCQKVFKDRLSGATARRPALVRCFNALKSGDTLIVWKLDRLGRSLSDLIVLLDDLRARGIKFRSLAEAIDTEMPQGRAMWRMVGMLAEVERSLTGERTRVGIHAAQRQGVKFGRTRKLNSQQVARARTLISRGEAPQSVASLLRVSRATLYRALAR
jgi:DNA invertase Pin-like site-specific DNA recombinase